MPQFVLPSRDLVPSFAPAPDDHLTDLIYHPVSGLVYRQRFLMALRALDGIGPDAEVLEVGCGAGLLLPSLSRIARHVEAVDIHAQIAGVQGMLARVAVSNVTVRHGSILQLPYANRRFTDVVCVSVLEHFRALPLAIAELARVTVPGGRVVLGFPTKNAVTRLLFQLVGYDDDVIHPSSHRAILSAARAQLEVQKVEALPRFAPVDLSLYVVAACRVAANHEVS